VKAKFRTSTWWIRYFVQTGLQENESALKKFEQAALKKSYKPACQVFHLQSYDWKFWCHNIFHCSVCKLATNHANVSYFVELRSCWFLSWYSKSLDHYLLRKVSMYEFTSTILYKISFCTLSAAIACIYFLSAHPDLFFNVLGFCCEFYYLVV
jgi:hypothetical protein